MEIPSCGKDKPPISCERAQRIVEEFMTVKKDQIVESTKLGDELLEIFASLQANCDDIDKAFSIAKSKLAKEFTCKLETAAIGSGKLCIQEFQDKLFRRLKNLCQDDPNKPPVSENTLQEIKLLCSIL